MARGPTIRDVAREAGVAIGTVSDALNGKGRVDPATRARVAEVAGRLGYRANRHASSLRSGRSAAIGLLLPVRGEALSDEALSLDFYMRLAAAAAASAFDHRQALMLLPPQPRNSDLRSMGLDGGIVVDPGVGDARVALFDSLGLPFVTIERDPTRDDGWFVASRPAENAARMLDHLAERGAKRIALLMPKIDWAWAAESLQGYEDWVREHKLPRIVAHVGMRPAPEEAYRATTRLLNRKTPPDAIFVLAGRFVRGALAAASDAGREVPRELMLATGVDGGYAREAHPGVTALELHPERQAVEAVDMLLRRVAGDPDGTPRFIPATLQARESTGG
jgi:DNA-binding LacI/PurR family transcriptional regulator